MLSVIRNIAANVRILGRTGQRWLGSIAGDRCVNSNADAVPFSDKRGLRPNVASSDTNGRCQSTVIRFAVMSAAPVREEPLGVAIGTVPGPFDVAYADIAQGRCGVAR